MFSFHQVVSVIFVVDEFILRASQRHIFTCLTTWCVPIDSFSQPPMRWGCRTFSWYFWFRRKNKLYSEMPTRHRNSKHSFYRWWMLWSVPRLIIFGVCVIFAIDKYILHAPQSQITSKEGTSVIFVINGDIFHARRRHTLTLDEGVCSQHLC